MVTSNNTVGLGTTQWAMLILLGIACIVLMVLILFDFVLVTIIGTSMEPTLSDGDKVWCKVLDYEAMPSEGYPVCCVLDPNGEKVIKRLIGYPGDTVQLVGGDTYVNGTLVQQCDTQGNDNYIFHLAEDQYLFLGDNRDNSKDGRYWEPHYTTREDIICEVLGSALDKE